VPSREDWSTLHLATPARSGFCRADSGAKAPLRTFAVVTRAQPRSPNPEVKCSGAQAPTDFAKAPPGPLPSALTTARLRGGFGRPFHISDRPCDGHRPHPLDVGRQPHRHLLQRSRHDTLRARRQPRLLLKATTPPSNNREMIMGFSAILVGLRRSQCLKRPLNSTSDDLGDQWVIGHPASCVLL
jgi:hypothetical protein